MKYLVLFVLLAINLQAQVEFKGDKASLIEILDQNHIINIKAEVKEKIPAKKAIMKLFIETENEKLSKALSSNSKIRSNFKRNLTKVGILETNIKETKFSSTPSYGLFSSTPSDYKVSNIMLVEVLSEEEMFQVAQLIDKNKKIKFISSKSEFLEHDEIENNLITKALQKAKQKSTILANELKLKIEPVSVDIREMQIESGLNNQSKKYSKMKSNVGSYQFTDNGFGERIYSLSLIIRYKTDLERYKFVRLDSTKEVED